MLIIRIVASPLRRLTSNHAFRWTRYQRSIGLYDRREIPLGQCTQKIDWKVSTTARDLSLPRHLRRGLHADNLRRETHTADTLIWETSVSAQKTTISLAATERVILATVTHTMSGDMATALLAVMTTMKGEETSLVVTEVTTLNARVEEVNSLINTTIAILGDLEETISFSTPKVITHHIRTITTTTHIIIIMVTTTVIAVRPTTTRDREDIQQINIMIFRMIATDLREEIRMVRAQIRTPINRTLTTNIERRSIDLLKRVIERMITEMMNNRETPSRIRKIIFGRRKTSTIAEDDYYKYYADSIVAFTCMLSIVNKDMHHVRQSNIQLTCYIPGGNSVQTRLRCSLLNCIYTLQVLQQVATND